jgi:CO/xanthine dehydrogenase Mo-binding subunit
MGKVRYVGEEVAAVAAFDLDTARRAVELIEVEYEELPAVFDTEEAMRAGAPLVHEESPGNVATKIDVERGDVGAAFAASAVVLEETYESHLQWHAAIETIGSVVEPHRDGRYTVWMNTQTAFMARGRIAWVLGVSEADVRVIVPYVGGGFGGKSCDDNNVMVCALLARKAGRPVRLINTREEDMLAGSRPRVPMKITVKMGFSADGIVQAKEIRLIADNGAYCGKAPGVFGVASSRCDPIWSIRTRCPRAPSAASATPPRNGRSSSCGITRPSGCGWIPSTCCCSMPRSPATCHRTETG